MSGAGNRLARYLSEDQQIKGVSKEILSRLAAKYEEHPRRVALLGFTEYAKHLVNLFAGSGQILAIADNDRRKQGWSFRSVPVVSLDEAMELSPEHFISTAINGRFESLGAVILHPRYEGQKLSFYPDDPKSLKPDPWKNCAFYRNLAEGLKGTLESLQKDTLLFLTEMLKVSLPLKGDVLEFGVWQGGSAYGMAKVMEAARADKDLVLIDLFELAPSGSPRGVMCLDQIKSLLSFYDRAVFHELDIYQDQSAIKGREFCFIHYDFSFDEGLLRLMFDALVPGGIMILDNYLDGIGSKERFDRFFASSGQRAAMTGQHVQGMVIKR